MRLTTKSKSELIDPGLTSQHKLEAKMLLQQIEGEEAVIAKLRARAEEIERLYGDDLNTLVRTRWALL